MSNTARRCPSCNALSPGNRTPAWLAWVLFAVLLVAGFSGLYALAPGFFA